MQAYIPSNWVKTELDNLGDILTGKTPSTKDQDNFHGDIPFIKPGDLDSGGYIHTTSDTLSKKGGSDVPLLPENSILVTCIGNIGKVGITTRSSAFNQQINALIPTNMVNLKYAYHYICTLKNWFESESSSTTISIINKGRFSKAPILLPSQAEQKEIADRLDKLLAQVETTQARLARILDIIKQFRQSVLSAAVSGKLVTIAEHNVVTVGSVTTDIRYGTSKKCNYDGGQTPVIRIPNIGNRRIDLSDLKYADFTEKELEVLALKTGDILVIRSNGSLDLVAKSALVDQKSEGFLYAGYLIRLRCNDKKILPSFLLNVMSSRVVRDVVEISARSTSGVNNINSKELASLEFVLPSITEQTEIVRRVEQLFAYADTIELLAKATKARVDNLTQAILAKAFRGELTAGWRAANPDLISGDNSAEALLEKIKTERQMMKPKKRTAAREKS